jgi:very-short-patch-repair endonuclease
LSNLTIANITNYKAPPPTKAELKLRSILNSKNLSFKPGQVIWYTNCHKYTPDLIIGRRLIIEVDGKIHDANFRKTRDRIRQRALKNMGFYVLRFKNEKIQSHPEIVAEEIIQKYYEIVDFDNNSKKPIVTAIKEPEESKEIPIDIQERLTDWTKFYNDKIKTENWTITANNFEKILTNLHPDLLKNECALESIILGLIGLNLNVKQNNVIDFEASAKLLEKYIDIMQELVPSYSTNNNNKANGINVFLKNMFNITAPNFFKNLIFNGGPKINENIIDIKDIETLESNIDCFNKYFEKLGIKVDPTDIKVECNATLNKINQGYNNSNFNWLEEWIKK